MHDLYRDPRQAGKRGKRRSGGRTCSLLGPIGLSPTAGVVEFLSKPHEACTTFGRILFVRYRREFMSDPNPERNENLDDLLQGMNNIENLAWWATIFVNVVCGILAAIFAWLQFRNYSIAQLIEKTEPEAFLRCIMFGFYLCWVFGPNFDVKVQKQVYVKDPHGGALTSIGLLLLVLFSLSAIFMLWATSDEKTFFVALTLFVILNLAGYFFIFHRMRRAAEASGHLFYSNGNFFRFAELVLVTEYMFGTWQRYRFLFMVISICILDALCFSTSLRSRVSASIHLIVPIQEVTIFSLLPDRSAALFDCVGRLDLDSKTKSFGRAQNDRTAKPKIQTFSSGLG